MVTLVHEGGGSTRHSGTGHPRAAAASAVAKTLQDCAASLTTWGHGRRDDRGRRPGPLSRRLPEPTPAVTATPLPPRKARAAGAMGDTIHCAFGPLSEGSESPPPPCLESLSRLAWTAFVRASSRARQQGDALRFVGDIGL